MEPTAGGFACPKNGPTPRGTETLLLVEDEPSLRKLVGTILRTQGYDVILASNGQEALNAVRDHKGSPIQLVITDVVMPLMGGKVLAEWLRISNPDLKIIFTSGYTNDEITQEVNADSGVEFLSKPYTPRTLACKVREMLDAPVTMTPALNQDEKVRRRTEVLFQEQLDVHGRRTDRMFAWLMVIQWLAGMAAAIWISPKAWEGVYSHTHIHVWAALFLGGIISGFPIFMALTRLPDAFELCQPVIAAGQMLSCGLLIHLTGGRIETHFQYFGALAFLAFYRDWRVLLTASACGGADHLLRGLYWPQSIFGVLVADWWRWLEHVGWVVFEDIFLVLAIRQNLREIRGVAERQAKLENLNESIERTVNERTSELRSVHQQLLDASRRSGMKEIAT